MTQDNVKSDIRKDTLRSARACWNCKHGVFNHRASSSLARVQGRCVVSCGESQWPRSWVPNPLFWEDIETLFFEGEDWEKFTEVNAPYYYGEKFKLELEFQDGLYVDMDQVRRDWEWMKWIFKRKAHLYTVGALQVCDLHQSPRE